MVAELWPGSIFAGSETALMRLDNLTVKQLVSQDVKNADIIDELMEDRQHLLASVLVGTNIAVVLSTVLATVLLRGRTIGGLTGNTVATWGMVILILFCGEIIPKRVATLHATAFALRAARPIQYAHKILRPIAALLVQIPQRLSQSLSIEEEDGSLDEDSLLTLVDMGEEEGNVEEAERDMIVGVLEFNHTLIRDVMTPRVDMVVINIASDADEIWQQVINSGLSRIPVYEDTIDNIVGVLYVKDILSFWQSAQPLSLSELMRDAYFVPETQRVGDLMRDLKRRRIHMAIVVDEYGGTAGLVTIEDLLEEIVGEIRDEFDVDEELEIISLSADSWLVDGRVPIDDISSLLETELPMKKWIPSAVLLTGCWVIYHR